MKSFVQWRNGPGYSPLASVVGFISTPGKKTSVTKDQAFNSFVTSGWEVGANAMASAKTKTEGGALAGAVTLSKGVKMLQLNGEGAIVGVSLTAAKYYKDKELS